MENEIRLIKALIIPSENYILRIEPVINNLNLPNLKFSKNNLNWIELSSEERKSVILDENKQNLIDNRKCIWFCEVEDIFFSKVCLFEETEYKFKFRRINNQSEESKDIFSYLNEFFETPSKWVKKGENIESRVDIKDIEKGTYLINFKSYTGKLKLKKDIIGNDINDIEVIATKLNKKNYFEILEGLNTFLSQIFFKYLSPTEILANCDYLKADIEYPKQWIYPLYIICQMIMKELSIYFSGIRNHLNTKFIIEQKYIEGYELSNPSNLDFIKTICNPENLFLINSNELLEYRTFSLKSIKFTFTRLIENIKKLNFNTVENRFIKYILNLIFYNLNKYEIKEIFRTHHKQHNLDEFETSIIEKIYYLDRLDIKDLQRIPYSSQILQKNSYYRRFFQYFMWLQNPIIFNVQNLFSIDIKPLHELYEFYCLFKMKEALDLIVYDGNIPLSFPDENHIKYEPNSNIKEYFAIKYIRFKYNYENNKEIHLIYKPQYLKLKNVKNRNILESYSTQSSQNPDFIIAEIKDEKVLISEENDINSIIIIDSKYRKDPLKLWKTVHFYKDALNAKGAIFINPLIKEEDVHHKDFINLMTPTENQPDTFVSAINLLGLIENENKFKPFLEEILQNYF